MSYYSGSTMRVVVCTCCLAALPVVVVAGLFNREILAVKKSGLENRLISVAVLHKSHGVTTVFRCEAVCLQNIWCDSFFFNKESGLCQTNNKIFTGTEVSTENIGTRYYIFQRGQESIPGFPGGFQSDNLKIRLGISVSKVTWTTAESICQDHSGTLISLDTQDRYNYVTDIIKSYRGLDREDVKYFVGLADRVKEKVWVWNSGGILPVDSPLWCSGQPDNGLIIFGQDYCAMWNSRECRLRLDDVSQFEFGYAICDLPYP